MPAFTKETSQKAHDARRDASVSKCWYFAELKQIALGKKEVTQAQWQALNALGRAKGWNRAPKAVDRKKKNGVSGAPGVSEELANRLQV